LTVVPRTFAQAPGVTFELQTAGASFRLPAWLEVHDDDKALRKSAVRSSQTPAAFCHMVCVADTRDGNSKKRWPGVLASTHSCSSFKARSYWKSPLSTGPPTRKKSPTSVSPLTSTTTVPAGL